jgi:hypothetical protein
MDVWKGEEMNIFSSVFGWFGEVFSGVTGEVVGDIKDIAIDAVNNAETLAGASGAEKQSAAFAEIQEKAIEAGIKTATHAINLAIEAAVAGLKS